MKKIEVKYPRVCRASNINEILVQLEFFFKTKEKFINNLLINFRDVSEASVLHVLVFFKFIDYAVLKDLLLFPRYINGENMQHSFYKYGFTDFFNAYLETDENDDEVYKKFEVKQVNGFLIAPQGLLRNVVMSRNSLQEKFLPSIQDYYEGNEAGISLLFTCLSEVTLNFWEHATEDDKSIIVAYGNKNNIEIACADNGQGIISTLKNGGFDSMDGSNIIAKAMQKGVTSKAGTNHMGYGLWLVSEIAKATLGIMHVYSEGYVYKVERGRVSVGKSGYWKGSIFYLSLPLNRGLRLVDIVEKDGNDETDSPTINWQ
ncbi:hypothetical protein GCM10027594_21750 [Hymenobacter agri]